MDNTFWTAFNAGLLATPSENEQTTGINWHQLSIPDAVLSLNSQLSGLPSDEAARRLAQYGPNALKTQKRISLWRILWDQFNNILVIILMAAVILSMTIGALSWESGAGMPEEMTDGIVIFIIIIAVVVLGFVQEFKSEKALDALQKMAAPMARVLRDGLEQEIQAGEVVPGDMAVLMTGDRIPADLRLVEAASLKTQEASLTGESAPVQKTTDIMDGEHLGIGDRRNMAFAGTVVVFGRGRGIVTGTGSQTEFGKIAAMLEDVAREETPLQENLDKVGKWLGAASLVIVAVLVIAQMVFVKAHSFVEMFIWGVSLAVAAVPEALPAVVVISLSIGVQKMAKRHALVKRLSAVETLGSTTVICSDKTGTLTQDQMTVRRIYVNGKAIDVSGVGYEPKGDFLFEGSPVDIMEDETTRIFMNINLLCNDTHLFQNDEAWNIKGDPTEGALIVLAAKAGFSHEVVNEEFLRVDEIPFSSETKRMTTIHQNSGKQAAYSKGAPEMVLENCVSVSENGEIRPLTEKDRSRILETARQMAGDALRVLGMAYKSLPEFLTDKAFYDKDMVFAGLAGMMDPPRPEAKDAIRTCEKAGIKSIMITGDHKITASAIARELGILKQGIAVTGAELDAMSDAEYARKVGEIEVYARVSPAHKLKVIEAFASRGDVVAMTGDGVNDAPALKKADIGVAMGVTGTDVSREAAAMVLTDDNFTSIVAAVEEGRVIFSNIKKYLMYLLSSNIGEILLMAGAIIFGPFLGFPPGAIPLVAVQILLVNLITDGFPAVALAFDPPDPDIMTQKPRPRGQGIFTKPVILLIAVGGIWSGIINLVVFAHALKIGKPLVEAQSLCFLSLIMIQLFKAYNFRSDRQSVFKIGLFRNKWLNLAVFSQVVLLAVIVESPVFNDWFNTFPLTWRECLAVALVAFTIFPVLEISKFFIRHFSASGNNDEKIFQKLP